ncbi:MAG: tRNA uridine-5-carboxymethylaminomethyl(34) synthesis GTPase MnmE [Blastocatellia bacterium]|nr:MAG: tRNA uridine-5-carboxymethylaminomethyl(34) synthesis GTPase MnmE [Blastocatellia bacterium]
MSTIVALSTPPGSGALSVVRLSGTNALKILKRLTSTLDFTPRTATLTKLHHPDSNDLIDEVIVTFFEAPHSLTGEDVVEISCHGSPSVVRQVIDASRNLGATLAGPGEFSLRALSNGKMNLAQAEAIRDLIAARTETAAKQAARQATGELSKRLAEFKTRLLDVIVVLESAVEFVEDDLPPTQTNQIKEWLLFVLSGVGALAESYQSGHLLRDGIQVAITGKPNVGKSSLFNSLMERDRAIVTAVPGTTRDTLSETIDVGGIPVVLTDTAGLRQTTDDVESLGIERAYRALNEADVVLLVVDGSVNADWHEAGLNSFDHKTQVVVNKIDLVQYGHSDLPQGILVSAKTGEGLDDLRAAILGAFRGSAIQADGLLVTNARHHEHLQQAKIEIKEALVALDEHRSEEMILAPLHNALRYLGEITGETTTEAILSQIFATFCIGK